MRYVLLVLVLVLALATGCGDPSCPSGEHRVGSLRDDPICAVNS